MSRPRLLDLFCGGGGAGYGYWESGFDVVGVDLNPQPSYPFEFHLAEALEFVKEHGHEFDAIHASPPCQLYSPTDHYWNKRERRHDRVDLVEPIRQSLVKTGRPYVIENVTQAPLEHPIVLCGAMFGLRMYRHRGFESSVPLVAPHHPNHVARCIRNGYLPTDDRPFMTITGRNGHHSKAWVAKAAEVMGTPWLSRDINAVCEAIPPAYTKHVGLQLLNRIKCATSLS